MNQVIIDQATRAKLEAVSETVELRDETGRILGHFVPTELSGKGSNEDRACPYSDEEIHQLRQQTGGRSLDEIWKRLGRN